MTTEPTPADLEQARGLQPVGRDGAYEIVPTVPQVARALAEARSSERETVLRRLTEGDVEPVAQAIYCAATDNGPTDWAFLQVRDSGSAADFYKQARAALTAVRDLLRKGQPT